MHSIAVVHTLLNKRKAVLDECRYFDPSPTSPQPSSLGPPPVGSTVSAVLCQAFTALPWIAIDAHRVCDIVLCRARFPPTLLQHTVPRKQQGRAEM